MNDEMMLEILKLAQQCAGPGTPSEVVAIARVYRDFIQGNEPKKAEPAKSG